MMKLRIDIMSQLDHLEVQTSVTQQANIESHSNIEPTVNVQEKNCNEGTKPKKTIQNVSLPVLWKIIQLHEHSFHGNKNDCSKTSLGKERFFGVSFS